MLRIVLYPHICVGGIVVSIAAFQAVDPGSIPGHRSMFLFKVYLSFLNPNEFNVLHGFKAESL
jgi:hypothetical protein